MFAGGCSAFSFGPADEQEFQQIASGGCRNRDRDFIIRGFVSNAGEATVVLADPDDSRSTMSLSLSGRGPLQRVKGVFGRSLRDLSEDGDRESISSRGEDDGKQRFGAYPSFSRRAVF